MRITGIHFNYYHLCHRKLWLFSNGINMEHTSDLVKEGELIHEESYPQRNVKYEEIEIDGVKVDFYDANNKIIHEIKKSNKIEVSHVWQLKFYIYVFECNGIEGCSGILEYPTLRKTQKVILNDEDREYIKNIKTKITEIVGNDLCPPLNKKIYCRNCSYFDFCFVDELNFK